MRKYQRYACERWTIDALGEVLPHRYQVVVAIEQICGSCTIVFNTLQRCT